MPALNTDKFMEIGNPGTATTLSAPGYTAGGATITVGSTSNWPTTTGVVFAIDEAEVVDGKEVQIAGTYNEFIGTVATGTSVTNVDWVLGSGDRSYSAGALTRVYVPVSAERENRLARGMVVEHKQNGTHGAVTADSLVTTGNVTIGGSLTIGGSASGGWDPISGTITAVTNNGNRSYDLTTSVTNAALVSPGMRLRTTRTVAAPTQSTSLNGTTQYWSKTTPAGMTFTDDFVVSAWVKLASYPTVASAIVSRYNGTSGWRLAVSSAGQVSIEGYNGSNANISYAQTYQSLPLNKWVHISAQLDMSAFTATTTTSYVMLDGVDVPCLVARGGTNPTALVQAGNLEIGAYNSGLQLFPGKIAQAAVFSAKVTQATMRGYISQGLSGSETSLISAYSFDNSINDLNTTTPNDLTASGAAVATNADSPFGGQAGGTISSTLDYGIIQKVTSTTVTVQVAEGCTIPTSGAISAVSYATDRSPFGFPGNTEKWSVQLVNIAGQTQISPTSNTYYNVGSLKITIPVGNWNVRYEANASGVVPSGGVELKIGLSTSTSGLSDPLLGAYSYSSASSHTIVPFSKSSYASVSTATIYYLILLIAGTTPNSIEISRSGASSSAIYAENAYL